MQGSRADRSIVQGKGPGAAVQQEGVFWERELDWVFNDCPCPRYGHDCTHSTWETKGKYQVPYRTDPSVPVSECPRGKERQSEPTVERRRKAMTSPRTPHVQTTHWDKPEQKQGSCSPVSPALRGIPRTGQGCPALKWSCRINQVRMFTRAK